MSDEKSVFLAIVVESGLAAQQRTDAKVCDIVDYLEQCNVSVPKVLKRNSATFCL